MGLLNVLTYILIFAFILPVLWVIFYALEQVKLIKDTLDTLLTQPITECIDKFDNVIGQYPAYVWCYMFKDVRTFTLIMLAFVLAVALWRIIRSMMLDREINFRFRKM